jgi:hypothetical protein
MSGNITDANASSVASSIIAKLPKVENIYIYEVNGYPWFEIELKLESPVNKSYFIHSKAKGTVVLKRMRLKVVTRVNNSDVHSWLDDIMNEEETVIKGLTDNS